MNQKGMSLFEVLLAVVILSAGLAFVHRSLLASVEGLKYAETRWEAQGVLAERMWEMQDYLDRMKKMPTLLEAEAISLGNRKARYKVIQKTLSPANDFFEIKHRLAWKSQGKNKSIEKTAYFFVPKMLTTP
ncbi:MAG: prepilin-type N-terminal cleavage/methylation domain-containing protein [Candidatus Omnitrophica bacterium]|nr:prepilin-type N-terminal cleavage/methylation domain-containing protein [Candidatus Omnitrophota bacterium]